MNNKEFKKLLKLKYDLIFSDFFLDIDRKNNKWELYSGESRTFEIFMTSEENTYEQLKKFVKKNKKYNIEFVDAKLSFYLEMTSIALFLIGVFTQNTRLRDFGFGGEIGLLLFSVIRLFFTEHNYKATYLKAERIRKRLEKELEELSKQIVRKKFERDLEKFSKQKVEVFEEKPKKKKKQTKKEK